MGKIISYLCDFTFRRKKAVLLSSAIFWLLCLYLSSGMKFSEDLFDLIPRNDPVLSEYRHLLDAFKFMDKIFIMLGPENEKISDDKLIEAGDALTKRMEESTLFRKTYYRIPEDSFFPVLDIFRKNRAAFFSEEYRNYVDAAIERKELEQRFTGWKKALTEAPTPYIGRMFREDPAGFDFYLLNKLKDLKNSGNMKIKHERFFSQDGRYLIIIAEPDISAGDIKGSEKIIKFMNDSQASLKDTAAIRLAYLCGHRFSAENAEMMKKGAALAMLISTVSIILLSILIYRKPLLVVMSVLPAVFGSVIALGGMTLIYDRISGIAIACGSMLTGIAVDYGIYLLFHIDRNNEARNSEETIKAVLRKIYLPLITGASTTLGVFVVMFFSKMPGYSQLSVFAFIGISSAAFFALFVFPLLIPFNMRNISQKPLWDVAGFFEKILIFSVNKKALVIAFAVLLTLGAAPGILKLGFDGDVQRMNVSSAEIEKDRKDIIEVAGDPLQEIIFAVKDRDYNRALHKNERLATILEELKKQNKLVSYSSISIFLPSEETERMNIERWEKFWNSERLAGFAKDIREISAANKIKDDVFGKFQKSLSSKYFENITENSYSRTFIEDIFSVMVAENKGVNFVVSRGNLAGKIDFFQISSVINELMPGVIVYRGLEMTSYIMNIVYQEFIKNGILSFLASGLIMWILFRRLKDMAITMLVLCFSLFWTFGLMGWLGMTINIMNCVVSVFVFGLVIDYSIFLISAMTDKEKGAFMKNTGGAVISSALTVIAGFGALCFGSHPALVSLGMSSVIAVCSGITAVIFLIPVIYSRERA